MYGIRSNVSSGIENWTEKILFPLISPQEERRIVYIGKISSRTTKDDVWRRFRPFGPIEKVTVHFRDDG